MAAGNSGLGNAGSGFEGHAEHQRIPVGEAAVHAAGVVCQWRLDAAVAAAAVVLLALGMVAVVFLALGVATFMLLTITVTAMVLFTIMVVALVFLTLTVTALVLREGVVVLGAAHGGGFEAVAELYAADAGNGKYGVGDFGLHAVPERLSHANGKAFRHTLNNAAKGISILLCGLQKGVPCVRTGAAANFREAGLDIGKMNHPFGNDAGRNNAQGEPAAEMAAAAGIVVTAKLEVGREISMTGPGVLTEGLVVLRAGVFIAEDDGYRSAGGMALIYAGKDFRSIGLKPGGCTLRARLAAKDVFREIFFTEGNSGKYAVHGYPNHGAVRLAEDADFEVVAKCIHNSAGDCRSRPAMTEKRLLNVGKDFATQVVSSIMTGPSAPREARERAIAMRWSAWEL